MRVARSLRKPDPCHSSRPREPRTSRALSEHGNARRCPDRQGDERSHDLTGVADARLPLGDHVQCGRCRAGARYPARLLQRRVQESAASASSLQVARFYGLQRSARGCTPLQGLFGGHREVRHIRTTPRGADSGMSRRAAGVKERAGGFVRAGQEFASNCLTSKSCRGLLA